jgi:hypothetical protein
VCFFGHALPSPTFSLLTRQWLNLRQLADRVPIAPTSAVSRRMKSGHFICCKHFDSILMLIDFFVEKITTSEGLESKNVISIKPTKAGTFWVRERRIIQIFLYIRECNIPAPLWKIILIYQQM